MDNEQEPDYMGSVRHLLMLLTWLHYKSNGNPRLFEGKEGEEDTLEFFNLCRRDDMEMGEVTGFYMAQLFMNSLMFHLGTLDSVSKLTGVSVEDLLKEYGKLAVEGK